MSSLKKILITGAGSYIGTSFERFMAQWPDEYRVDTVDMVDGSWREKSFAGYDCVFHVAGIAHISTKKLDEQAREKYWKVNALLPVEVAQKAKAEGVGQFIFLSSMSVYGEHGSIKHPIVITKETKPAPKDIYGKSKLKAEEGLLLLDDVSFRLCVMRPPMIYGPGCKGNYQLLVKATLKLPFFPDIQNERSMLFIDNLCAYAKAVVDGRLSGIHFPQNSEYVCTSKMVEDIAHVHGRRIRLTMVFNPIMRFLSSKVSVVDKVFGSLLYDKSLSVLPHETIPATLHSVKINIEENRLNVQELIEGLVSVIMPVYNCEKYLTEAIESVLSQSYAHLELIAVNDCSTDKSGEIVQQFAVKDIRVQYFNLSSNSGAAVARNMAVQLAKGEYLAFLDSDDLWKPDKLETQLAYMKERNSDFCCTSYAVIDEFGALTGEIRTPHSHIDYQHLLFHNIGNSTVIYNAKKLGKIFIPPIRKRNDYVMWLAVIKKSIMLIGLQEILTSYRVRPNSLSINKGSLLKFHFLVYRDIEKLSWLKTLTLIIYWIGKTLLRSLKLKLGLSKQK